MKKILFILYFAILPLVSHAQLIHQGNNLYTDSAGYTVDKNGQPLTEEQQNDIRSGKYKAVGDVESVSGSKEPMKDDLTGSQNVQPQFLQNPLKGIGSISALVLKLVNVFTSILWIIAALAFLWSGFMFIKAQGEPKAIEEARTRFKNVLIGTAIIAGAETLRRVIENVLSSLNI